MRLIKKANFDNYYFNNTLNESSKIIQTYMSAYNVPETLSVGSGENQGFYNIFINESISELSIKEFREIVKQKLLEKLIEVKQYPFEEIGSPSYEFKGSLKTAFNSLYSIVMDCYYANQIEEEKKNKKQGNENMIKRLKRKSEKENDVINKILEKGNLVRKKLNYLEPDKEVGMFLEGEVGVFYFEVSDKEILEKEINQLKENEDEIKLLIVKTLKEKCTKNEQYGWTWCEAERYTGNEIDGEFGKEDEVIFVDVEFSDESIMENMHVNKFEYIEEEDVFKIEIDFDMLNYK